MMARPSVEDDGPPPQAVGEESLRALEARPTVSIRTRLTGGLLVWFVVSLGLAIASIVTISLIKQKLHFTEAVDSFSFEVQQARRFEKNFFLYHTNLSDALDHVRNAELTLARQRENIITVIGQSDYAAMGSYLTRYEELLVLLQQIELRADTATQASYAEVEAGLRDYGSELIAVVEDLVARERASVESMLVISQRIPIVFLIALILLITALAVFVARQMLAPLNRMMEAAGRIAVGDFTPIRPKRRYHDEFSELALAMNRMMLQLEHRHGLLVKAHKLQAVGTLTAGVAHELNNPINNIMLTASTLLEDYHDLPDEERLEMIEDVVGESERTEKIVKNLLDFARESSMESDALRAEDIVAETLRLAGNQVKLAHVKVKGELEPDLPPVFGDRQQLTQVFLNIVLNALHAMPDGGTLDISARNTKERNFVSVEFADSGVGIPEHQINNIFDPFFSTKPDAKGTGLGLSVSLGIIRQHGGNINVESQVGVGTKFTISLPTARVPAVMGD
jgi:two-component system, NtrC family, sensor kinase